MSLNIKVASSEDIEFEGALLLAPASNYSDGITKGFRPAIRWAMVKMPNIISRSGLFNIKGEVKQPTPSAAFNKASERLFAGDCMCSALVDYMLETYADEA
jgi:hypothetical protein